MPMPAASALAATLLANRHAFKAFLAARLGNEADAEDLLQNSLLRALQRADELKDDEKAVAWFYGILRHAVVDHARSRHASAQREQRWAADAATLAADPDAEKHLCACFERLLPTLRPAQAEWLRRVELGGESVATVAAALGLTANAGAVALHRARRELRARLEALCGSCECLDDCVCAPPTSPGASRHA